MNICKLTRLAEFCSSLACTSLILSGGTHKIGTGTVVPVNVLVPMYIIYPLNITCHKPNKITVTVNFLDKNEGRASHLSDDKQFFN